MLGCSTGYGLASRIVATFAGGADTIGVSLEREPSASRTGSAGWYNNRAFEIEAKKIGRSPLTLEGDAFSDELKTTFIDRVREKFGQLDMLVYSMAAPVRTDPQTGKTYRSAIKPLGAPVEIKTLNTETGEVYETTITPASEDEAAATVAVMGGEDWKRWIDQLADAGVLAPGFRTLNYTYIGSELTWPIYWNGTLGRAKVDLDRKAEAIRGRLGADAARVVALKAVVTQASSAIPVVPLYGTVLFKVMKQLGLHEGCIEQIDRLFRTRLGAGVALDEAQRVRVDDWELSPEVQAEVLRRWPLLIHRNARRTGRPRGIQEPIPSAVRIWHRGRRLHAGRGPARRPGLERFQAKWVPVRVKKTRQTKLDFGFASVAPRYPMTSAPARWNAGRAEQASR